MIISTNRNWLITSVIFSVLFGILVFFASHDLISSFFVFLTGLIGINIYLLYIRCPRCGMLGALYVTSTRRLNSDQRQRHFSQCEPVGKSVRRNRNGDMIDATTHYNDVNYVTTTTTNTYEDTITCSYCGDISKKQYQRHSDETHRT